MPACLLEGRSVREATRAGPRSSWLLMGYRSRARSNAQACCAMHAVPSRINLHPPACLPADSQYPILALLARRQRPQEAEKTEERKGGWVPAVVVSYLHEADTDAAGLVAPGCCQPHWWHQPKDL